MPDIRARLLLALQVEYGGRFVPGAVPSLHGETWFLNFIAGPDGALCAQAQHGAALVTGHDPRQALAAVGIQPLERK